MPICAFVFGDHKELPRLVCNEVQVVQVEDVIAFRQGSRLRSPHSFEHLFETQAEAAAWAARVIEEYAAKVLAEASKLDGIQRTVTREPAALASTEEAAV